MIKHEVLWKRIDQIAPDIRHRTNKQALGRKIDADIAAKIYSDARGAEMIAKDYGVSPSLVFMIKRGERWKRINT